MADAPTIITRSRVSKDRRLLLLPPIQKWINDDSKAKLAVKSRRVGWTYGEAYDVVSSRKTGRRKFNYWYTCTDKDGAREFVDYCEFFLGLKHAVVEELLSYETPEGEKEECWSFVIRPTEDTKITAMPSRPAALRGKSGDVGCDELAFHPHATELYKAARSVMKWGGSFRAWSSHNGDATLFSVFERNCRRVLEALGKDPDTACGDTIFKAIQDKARAMRVRPVLSYHFCNIFTAIEQGLVELLNEVIGESYTRESFLDECREECIDDDHFDQEYGGRARAAGGQWLSLMLLAANEDKACAYPNQGLVGYEGGPCYVGVDFARNHDMTVVWVLERVGDVFWTRQIHRIRNMDTPNQAAELAGILKSIKLVTCAHDSTGNGLGLYEYTAKEFGHGRIHGVQFASSVPIGKKGDKDITIPVRQSMATTLKTLLEERKVRLPLADDSVRQELLKLKTAYTATGQMTFAAARDKNGHADHFWALALAVSSAIHQTVPFVFKGGGNLIPLPRNITTTRGLW